MFIDLDRFKMVNDLLGHDAGDALLVEIGHRIDATIRATDTVARLGGDEFVVLCEEPGQREDLALLAGRILEVVEQPVTIGASVGIALASPADDPDALLRDADAAMYRAKANGRGRYEFFSPTGEGVSESRETSSRRPD
jgi:diguanylate cyclase (GGDEF)-like protein